jgi:hypothetical protein
MGTATKYEILFSIRSRYLSSSKKEKKKILDEFCATCNYNRKYAVRLLNYKTIPKISKNLSRRGRKKHYNNPVILTVLRDIWVATNLPCSKRLKAILPLWLPHYNRLSLSDLVKCQLLEMSAATIDRLMKPSRSKYNKHGLCTTKPGSIIKKQIPIKTNQWDEQKPGFMEADTVAHCGSSTTGTFISTVNLSGTPDWVDISTTWTEQRAVWGKGETGVRMAIQDMEQSMPFPVLGFDCDNGSEFLNWHLVKYFTNRKNPVQFTRAYMKNDNAHIENKNWTHAVRSMFPIRLYLGYQRFDKHELVAMLNELYTMEWNLYFNRRLRAINYFTPSVKLIEKQRIGSKIIKRYDKPKTPFRSPGLIQRVLESEYIPSKTKKRLQEQFLTLNPFELEKQMMLKIRTVLNIVNQTSESEKEKNNNTKT